MAQVRLASDRLKAERFKSIEDRYLTAQDADTQRACAILHDETQLLDQVEALMAQFHALQVVQGYRVGDWKWVVLSGSVKVKVSFLVCVSVCECE